MVHDGSYRTPADSWVPVVINTRNGRVGFISVAYRFNGNELDHAWQVNTINIGAIKAKARFRRQAGADLVVVAMHAGGEYESTPNLEQKNTAKALLADPDITKWAGSPSIQTGGTVSPAELTQEAATA